MSKKILFVCIENSNRSQMAEAFARMHGSGKIIAYSAGSNPSGRINPKAIEAMRQKGYDLMTHDSKSVEHFRNMKIDYLVRMGCGDECPYIRAEHVLNWNIPDPKELEPTEFNIVCNRIEQEVMELISIIKE